MPCLSFLRFFLLLILAENKRKTMNHERRKVKFVKGNGSPIVTTRQDRNAKYKCGSGKKAKHCCGTDTKYFSTKPDKTEQPEKSA